MTGEQFVASERERFEEWAERQAYSVETDGAFYKEWATLLTWTAWLAAKTQAMQEGGSKC